MGLGVEGDGSQMERQPCGEVSVLKGMTVGNKCLKRESMGGKRILRELIGE